MKLCCMSLQIVQKSEEPQTSISGGQPTVAEQLLKRQQAVSTTVSSVSQSPAKTTDGVVATSPPPTPVKTTPSAAQQKYAVTPQVVQEGLCTFHSSRKSGHFVDNHRSFIPADQHRYLCN